MTFYLLGGFKINPSAPSGDVFSVRLARDRVSIVIVRADIGCHYSTVAEGGIDRPVRVEAQQGKRSIVRGRQVDASTDHDLAVRQNEKSVRALPNGGDGYDFAAIAKRGVEGAIRIVASQRDFLAWVGIADGDDLAVGLDSNATQPVGAVGKISYDLAIAAEARIRVSVGCHGRGPASAVGSEDSRCDQTGSTKERSCPRKPTANLLDVTIASHNISSPLKYVNAYKFV